MRIDSRIVLGICVPLAAVATLLLSAGGEQVVPDAPPRSIFGFPFFWALEDVNSLSLVVALPALLLDYLLYLLLTLALATFVRWSRLTQVAAGIAWVVALGVIFVHWRIVSIDPTYVWWLERDAVAAIEDYGPRLFTLMSGA